MYDRVLLFRSVLDTIRAEVRSAGKIETGGAMVGYESQGNTLTITDVSGPGPRAQLARKSVLIDGQYAARFCFRIHSESGGQIDYVGDWHRHLGWSLKSSDLDVKAMQTIQDAKCCSVRYPVSVIYRSRPEGIAAYLLERGELHPVRVKWLERSPYGQRVR